MGRNVRSIPGSSSMVSPVGKMCGIINGSVKLDASILFLHAVYCGAIKYKFTDKPRKILGFPMSKPAQQQIDVQFVHFESLWWLQPLQSQSLDENGGSMSSSILVSKRRSTLKTVYRCPDFP